jgi:hypothetical protein
MGPDTRMASSPIVCVREEREQPDYEARRAAFSVQHSYWVGR